MSEEIQTQSVNRGVAITNPVTLLETPELRIVFFPTVHGAGVTGSVVKFKKDKKSKWSELQAGNFKSHALAPMEKVDIPLNTEVIKKLVEAIKTREEIVDSGIKRGEHDYVTVEKNKIVIIDDLNKKSAIEQIMTKGYSDEFWQLLTANEPALADRLSSGRLTALRQEILNELKTRLEVGSHHETKGADSWQSWIYENHWLFGANYQTPIEKQKINITGVMPDYLFPTIDGFVDLLEIKLPKDQVIVSDTHHAGSWKWTDETNIALGQVVNYLSEIEKNHYQIAESIRKKYGAEVSMLKPRAYVLIGNSESWNLEKKEALRKLNHSLHGIEVITYQQLLTRGEAYIASPVAGVGGEEIENITFEPTF